MVLISPFEDVLLISKLILHILFNKYNHMLVAKLFFDSIKWNLRYKNMRFVKMSGGCGK
jgi:hypothetical protein